MTTPALLLALFLQGQAGWTCDAALYDDGVCDCGCGAQDADCADAHFQACARDGCPAGQVPWEHENASCMASACGDGWKADDEACDDFDSVASGGCSADCSAVTEGATCGARAEGCTPPPSEGGEGEGEGEGEHDDDGHSHGGGGCAATPGALPIALLALLRRRR